MEMINDMFATLSGMLWGWPMIVLLLGTHIFLTLRLKMPQRRVLTALHLSVKHDRDAQGSVSQFGALATALAATIGTGNIVGVATAVTLGGPGAVLWCWLTGVFGMATKYAEGLLAVKYRVRTPDGATVGGPMYVLERGLGMKWLAVVFAVCTAAATLGIGCTVQSNSIALLAHETFGMEPWVVGLAVCVLAACVILGGVRSIARVCGMLVPLMAVLYVVGCCALLVMNGAYLWPALKLIVSSAFDPAAVGGGFAGGTVLLALRYGVARGLFSNESGMGSAPIVAAAAQTRNPVRQALVSSTGTFWDTVVICALTGLVLVSSILAWPDISYADGAALTKVAFSKLPYVGAPLLAFGILTFAFSTILGWSYYGESAVVYLSRGRGRSVGIYRVVFIVALFFGSVMSLDLIWNVADCMNALMTVPNLIALLMLSGVAARETDRYLWANRLDDHADADAP